MTSAQIVRQATGSPLSMPRVAEGMIAAFLMVDALNIRLPLGGSGVSELNATYILVFLLVPVFLLERLVVGRFIVDRSLFNITFGLLAVWALINARVFSIDPVVSTKYGMILLLWWLTYNAFIQMNRVDPIRIIKFYADMLFIYIVISIVVSLAMGHVRLSGVTIESGLNRIALLAIVFILLMGYLRAIRYGSALYNNIAITVGLVAVAYAGSRTVYLILAVMAILALSRRTWTFRAQDVVKMAVIFAVGLLGLVTLAATVGGEPLMNHLNKLLGFVVEINAPNEARLETHGRMDYLLFAMEVLSRDPGFLLTGTGLEAYRAGFNSLLIVITGANHTLHNVYLQYLIGLGIPGLTLYLALIGFLRHRLSCVSDPMLRDMCLLIFLVAVLNALFQPTIFSRLLFLFLPLIAATNRVPRSHRGPPREERIGQG